MRLRIPSRERRSLAIASKSGILNTGSNVRRRDASARGTDPGKCIFPKSAVDTGTAYSYIVSINGNCATMKHSKADPTALHKIYEMQCDICKALGHPLRLAILNRLGTREVPASDLIADLGISKAALSKHMTLLAHGGIVESRRDGRQILYRLTDTEIHKACEIMRSILYRRLKGGEKLASAISSVKAPR